MSFSAPLAEQRELDQGSTTQTASTSTPIVEASALAKCYQIYNNPQDRLRQFLWRGRKQFFREFWALHPVTFSIARGECVGFVGRNGSGKSTLLQILAGTLTPSSGSCSVHGRIAALLELGAGFNPEFSGRENVAINASLLGLTSNELKQRFQSIVDFSEIGSFIDEPVKTYSSGMFVRLAFSVAVHVSPDVLIVDEALSVGDAAFQYKCLRKIEELQQRGTSIILVTHDSAVVKRFCTRAGWLHEGDMISFGDAVEVVNQYEDFCRQQIKVANPQRETAVAATQAPSVEKTATQATPISRVVSTTLLDAHNNAASLFVMGASVTMRITYEVEVPPEDGLVLGAALFRKDDLYICGVNTLLDKSQIPATRGTHRVSITYSQLSLLPGSYYFKVGLFDKTASVRWDFLHHAAEFVVNGPYVAEGVCRLAHEWSVES